MTLNRPIPDSYWVYRGSLLAGEYPGSPDDDEAIRNLRSFLEAGVNVFIDLTEEGELEPYLDILNKESDNLGISVRRLESGLLASGLSANTVHHVHVVLSKSIKDALRKGIVHRNVCQLVDPPRPGRYEVRVPDAQAIREILSLAATTSYAALLHFMAYTGVRRGEAIALRWESVDLDRGLVSIVETAQRLPGKGIVFQPTKSAAGRRGIALDSITIDVFRAHKGSQILYQADMEGKYQDHGLVFPGPFGGPVDPSVVTRNFEKLARKSGYAGVRLHDLRHGHAAGLIRAGAHPRVVQERLGHSSAAFTMQVYGHVSAGLQAKAAQDFAALMSE